MEHDDSEEMALAIAESLRMAQTENFSMVDIETAIQNSLHSASPNEPCTECNLDLAEDNLNQLSKDNGVHLSYLRRKLGVGLKISYHGITPKLQITAENEAAVKVAKQYIMDMFRNSEEFCFDLEQERKQYVHVFVDNTNIILGSQNIPGTKEKDKTIRVSIDGLAGLVEGGRTVAQRVTFGSYPQNPNFWARWERRGYKVHLLEQDGGAENFVDDGLIAQIQEQILRFPYSGRTLVLLTGDGNLNHGRVSFADTVSRALQYGWRVEVWCWRQSANRCYTTFQHFYSATGCFKLFYLDDFRSDVTFVATPAVDRDPMGYGAAWDAAPEQIGRAGAFAARGGPSAGAGGCLLRGGPRAAGVRAGSGGGVRWPAPAAVRLAAAGGWSG